LVTTTRSGTGAVSFVSWVRHHGRSQGLADRLGADAVFVAVGRSGNRWTVPARYAVQAVRTVRYLRRHRPGVVLAMAPPMALPVLCRLVHHGVLVLDAHTGAVLRGDRVRPSFVRLARRCDVVLVASEALRDRLERETGIPALAVHDPVTPGSVSSPRLQETAGRHRTVVFPAGWRADEPMDAVLDAARRLGDGVAIVITGSAPDGLTVPGNVRLSGFLAEEDYDELVRTADVVLALTTRSQTMQRAGYEALAHGRPLVASDTDVLREFFTAGTVLAQNTGASIAAAVERAIADGERLAEEMRSLRDHRVVEDDRAVAALREAIERC
jgi:glycosyltransferase involved in cell wall biosynthesis